MKINGEDVEFHVVAGVVRNEGDEKDRMVGEIGGAATKGEILSVLARMIKMAADGWDDDDVDFADMMGAVMQRGKALGYWGDEDEDENQD